MIHNPLKPEKTKKKKKKAYYNYSTLIKKSTVYLYVFVL